MSFVVEIASVPDRDHLVAEIWWDDCMVGEIRRTDDGGSRLEIYAQASGMPWSFDFCDWLEILQEAKKKLDSED